MAKIIPMEQKSKIEMQIGFDGGKFYEVFISAWIRTKTGQLE